MKRAAFYFKQNTLLIALLFTQMPRGVFAETTGKIEKLEKAVSIFKNLYDVGSSVVSSATDYAAYTASARLERYSEKWESWDHGCKDSVERVHWVDEIDGTSKYRSISFKNDVEIGPSTIEAFPHGWGNCTLNCGIITNSNGIIISGERTTIRPTKFRLQAQLDQIPKSTLHLIDPLPVWYVFKHCNPSSTNACGALYDSTLTIKSVGFGGRAFKNRASNQVLDFPLSNSLSQSGEPMVFIAASEK